MDQKVIADHKEITDNFNVLYANIGAKLSAGNNHSNCAQSYSDYLNNPTPHRFTFSTINKSYILTIINKLKNKNSSGNDEISNKLLNPIRSGLFQAVNDPGGGGALKAPPLRSRKLFCQSSPYHTCECYQVFLA